MIHIYHTLVVIVLPNFPSPLNVYLASLLSDNKLQNESRECLHPSIMKPKYHYIMDVSSHQSEGNDLQYLLISCK